VQEDPLQEASGEVSEALSCLKLAQQPSRSRPEKHEAVQLATLCIQSARELLNSNNRYTTSRYVRSALHHMRKWDQENEQQRLDNLDRLYKARRRLRIYRYITRPLSRGFRSITPLQA